METNVLNTLPGNKILDMTKLKVFGDYKFNAFSHW